MDHIDESSIQQPVAPNVALPRGTPTAVTVWAFRSLPVIGVDLVTDGERGADEKCHG
jgi:hypothetical protein